MILNPRQVEAFRAVMLAGSMTAAAEILRVSQPAVSRLVQDLEFTLDMKLFDRHGNRLTPRQESLALFKEVSRYYSGLERIAHVAAEIRAGLSGELRVATFNALSFGFAAMAIDSLLKNRPNISVYHETEASRAILELVSLQEYDIGIVQISGEYPGVEIERLPMPEALCVLPPNHRLCRKRRIDVSDLAGENLISLGRSSPLRVRLDAALQEAGIECRRLVETTLAATACDLVMLGHGIAVVDPFTVRSHASRRVAARPFTPSLPVEIAMVFPANQPRAVITENFAAIIRERMSVFPADAAKDERGRRAIA